MKLTKPQIINSFSKHPKYPIRPKNFVISDNDYFCPKIDIVKNIIYPAFKIWLISCGLDQWTRKWDCENFADGFKLFSCAYHSQEMDDNIAGIAIGVINYISEGNQQERKGPHAINIIYSPNIKVNNDNLQKFDMFFLEPQTGELYDLSEKEFKSIFTVYI